MAARLACAEYLIAMHVRGAAAATTSTPGVLPEFTGILVCDGYTGYAHLPAVHAGQVPSSCSPKANPGCPQFIDLISTVNPDTVLSAAPDRSKL